MNSLNRFRVLVIDDDDFMLQMATIMLEKLGIEDITVCSNPRSLLSNGNVIEADLIICDLNMPEMDGIECVRYFSATHFPGAIALVSGEEKRILSSAESLASAQNLNVVGSLEKPFTSQNLNEILQRARVIKVPNPKSEEQMKITPDMLRDALEKRQLMVYYQPKVEIQSGRFSAVESLVRWRHPQMGIISPGLFIPLAEEHGFINEIADCVLREAMNQGGAWHAQGLELKIAINLSLKNLDRLDFPEWSTDIAREAKLPLSSLIFEVTETSLMRDYVTCLEILTRLRLKGATLSIDDFGTGFSSMEQLMRIPFSELKIDRSFVSGASHDPAARAILDSSVDLAKRLKMIIVAEGVETKGDWDLIAGLGCDIVQGYYVARPMPSHEIPGWATQWNQSHAAIV